MFRQSILRPAVLAVVLAAALAPGCPAAARARGATPPPRSIEPQNLSPLALGMWRWREAQDRRIAGDASVTGQSGAAAALDDLAEIQLNDSIGILGTDQRQLAMASMPGHNIVVAWRDNRAGDGDIRALVLDPSGIPILPADQEEKDFIVNDDGQSVDQSQPSVAMNSLGNFVIAWVDFRGGSPGIFMQRFHADGTLDSTNIGVNIGRDENVRYIHAQPAVAIDDLGNVVAAWTDDRRGTNDIYATRINPDDSPHFLPFQVTTAFSLGSARIFPADNVSPGIAFTGLSLEDSGFVVSWQGRDRTSRGGAQMMLARRFSTFDPRRGAPQDTLVARVDDLLSGSALDSHGASSPRILPPAADDTSHALTVVWTDSIGAPGQILARRLYPAGWTRASGPFHEPSAVISDEGQTGLDQPALARLRDGSVLATWGRVENSGSFITVWGRILSPDLTPSGPGVQLNSSDAHDPRLVPRAVPFGTATEPEAFMAGWVERQPVNDAVAVRVFGSGASSDSVLTHDREPDQIDVDVAYNAAGQGVAVWTDFRNGKLNPDIYGQQLDTSGARVGGNFRVNSDAGTAYQGHARAGVDSLGSFTVVWEDTRRGTFQVYVRRFAPDGTPAGAEFSLAPIDTSQQFRPSIAVTPSSGSVVVWEDNVRGFRTSLLKVFDIYLRPLSASGAVVGNAVRVSPLPSDTGSVTDPTAPSLQPKLNPCAALDAAGNGLVFWDVTALIKQGSAGQISENPDVDARFFLAPSRLVPMADGQGRTITGDAFSVADSLNSGFLFPQQHSRAGYVGEGVYAVAFEDERLGSTSREDIRARLIRVQIGPDTVRIFTPAQTFGVNDDIVLGTPDPVTGERLSISASQFAPAVAANPADHTFTIAWTDRRFPTSYNVMRQSYLVVPATDPTQRSQLRFLGRNSFANADWATPVLTHGASSVAYAGPGKIAVAWQSNQRKSAENDVFARILTQAPDTCANDSCFNGAPAVHFEARLDTDHAVTLRWRVPAAQAGGSFQVLRIDVPHLVADPRAVPQSVAQFGASRAEGQAEDELTGSPSDYLYELMRDGQILAVAAPSRPEARFALQLAGASPNPARSLTRIQFTVPGRSGERVPVRLRLFDVAGRQVRTLAEGQWVPGAYTVEWRGETQSGTRAAAGVYFLRMEAAGQVETRKLLWLR